MAKILIKNGLIINRGKSFVADLLIRDERIEKVDNRISSDNAEVIDAAGNWVLPGIIDDQVHFREPGLNWKGDIYSESRAALAGGVTSFMEMPNTKPPAVTQGLLQAKYEIAARNSVVNYSFYIGATNDNYDELMRTDAKNVCGIKIFMGSSTGNMLVDDHKSLDRIFANAHIIIATHCEDEQTIRKNVEDFKTRYTEFHSTMHPVIRSREACIKSSRFAMELAKKYGSRLHVLHISTKEECELFENIPLSDKNITAEACVHHLYFDDSSYPMLGNLIKCNPAIKSCEDRTAIRKAVIDGRIDVIATDHAPHTWEEKMQSYMEAPSGLPLIQHSLLLALDWYHEGGIGKELLVEKMCHAPAELFEVKDRGYLDEGMFADLLILDAEAIQEIDKTSVRYRCNWSPLEGQSFKGKISHCFVNGKLKLLNGNIIDLSPGMRLQFRR